MRKPICWMLSIAMILTACGGMGESPDNRGVAGKGDGDDVSTPTIAKNHQGCIDHDPAFPDAVGDTSSTWLTRCVKWIPISGGVLTAIHDMAGRTWENASDYDAWTTQLYVFQPKYSMGSRFSMYDIERLTADLGVDKAYLMNFQFSVAKDAGEFDFASLKWMGITHEEHHSDTIEAYLHNVLDGEMATVIEFGEDETFQGNHQFTLILSDKHIVYMRHYRYDA